MKRYFEQASAQWVKYDHYIWKKDIQGHLFLLPDPDAPPSFYDPIQVAEALVLDALNIGRMCMGSKPEAAIQDAMMAFAEKYGLFGLMTALPTTANFMDYEAVYLPKNRFIRQETMNTQDYLRLFFPFDELDVVKSGIESMWNLSDDKQMMALALTMRNLPMAVNMCFQRSYAERYDWLKSQFKDWAFILSTSVLYYTDYDILSPDQKDLYQEAMATLDGNTPTYHIALYDKPTIVWDFHSLLLGIQLLFSFMLTDDTQPLHICKQCAKVFLANRKNQEFCSPECKNLYGIHRNRGKE